MRVVLISIFLALGCHLLAQVTTQSQFILKVESSIGEVISSGKVPPEWEEIVSIYGLEFASVFPETPERNLSATGELGDMFFYVNFRKRYPSQKQLGSFRELPGVLYLEPRQVGRLAYNPNDSLVSSQLYLTTINAFKAWDISKGSSSVLIGLLDSGVDTNHRDLKANIYRNTADPVNGVDDDADGFTDNYLGWDFESGSGNPQFTSADHGVQMFGALSPATDNGIGVAGPAFNCPVLAVKVTTGSQVTHGYEGIKYAADMGCKVINCSWNFSTYSKFGEDMVNYAISKGALVVAAAGNQGNEGNNYPAAYENCLGVGATDYNDNVTSISNFGYWLDLSTVGINVFSTRSGNRYEGNSGTSYSSAIVSGGAALLRSYRTSLSPEETMAYLKAASRDLYSGGRNDFYLNKAGVGALDMENAMKYDGSAYIEMINYKVSGNNQAFSQGDTIDFTFDLKNYLANSNSVTLVLRSADGYSSILTSSISIPSISKGATISTVGQPIKVRLDASIPSNHQTEFELLIIESGDTNRAGLSILVNPTFYEINEYNIHTAIGNRGTYGWYLYPQKQGVGVKYKSGGQLLYEGGFLLASGTTGGHQVSDRIRGIRDVEQEDFEATSALAPVASWKGSTLSIEGVFDDRGSSSPIGAMVRQRAHVWNTASRENFVILEYQVSSNNSSTLSNVYAGILADWDLENFEKNKAEYDGQRYLAYTYSTENKGVYCGIQLLSEEDAWKTYAIDHVNGGAGGIDLTDNDVFSKAEKFEALSNTREKAGEGSADGNDVLQMISTGPHQIASDTNKTFAFAIHVAEDLAALQRSADTAFYLYNQRIPDAIEELGSRKAIRVFPNPANNRLNIQAEVQLQSVELLELSGKSIISFSSGFDLLDVSGLSPGLYLLKWESAQQSGVEKLLIRR